MSNYRPYKFLVVPVIQEVDEDGNVVQEMSPEQPQTVFGVEGLRRFADTFELDLAARTTRKERDVRQPLDQPGRG
jgi:hypothetical protein